MSPDERMHFEKVISALDAQRLALEARQREIATCIATLEHLIQTDMPADQLCLGSGPALATAAPVGAISPDAFFGMSIAAAAKKLLKLKRTTQSTKEIAEALKKGGIRNSADNFAAGVSSVLSREAKKRTDVIKIARGKWGLYEWYADRQKKSPNAVSGATVHEIEAA